MACSTFLQNLPLYASGKLDISGWRPENIQTFGKTGPNPFSNIEILILVVSDHLHLTKN